MQSRNHACLMGKFSECIINKFKGIIFIFFINQGPNDRVATI